MEKFGPLVEAAWLADHLHDPDLRIVDFRWNFDHNTGQATSGRAAYEHAHIPGAVHVDLEDVCGHQQGAGRHPLPDADSFQRVMREAGINRDSRVVVYDDEEGLAASRLWWTLGYFGHDAVAILDGGFPAWSGPLKPAIQIGAAGDFIARPRPARKLDHDQIRRLLGDVVLLDARRKARYLGQFEPTEPQAGHIPGARSAYWRDNLTPTGLFKSPADLRTRFQGLGIEEGTRVVAYCASGVSACHDLLALEIAGLGGGRLYPGSWSDWSRRPDAPTATGDEWPQPDVD